MRIELLQKKIIGKHVYKICCGFLKLVYDQTGDPLDQTRIHPELYDLAKKICTEALDKDDEEVVENVMQDPKPLESLDLEAYAIHL